MFIRYNNTAKYWEYDTSAAQSGAGPWTILELTGYPPGQLPANVAYRNINNGFTVGQSITGDSNVAGIFTASAAVRGGGIESRGNNGRVLMLDAGGPVNQRTWSWMQYNAGTLYLVSGNDTVDVANLISIDRSGVTTFLGNYTVHNAGAYFPTRSSNVGLLDCYEEGGWAPTFLSDTGGAGTSYSIQQGYYTRVGQLVFVSFALQLTGASWNSGNILMGGFPFVNNNEYAVGKLDYWQIAGPPSMEIKMHFPANANTAYHIFKNVLNLVGHDGVLAVNQITANSIIRGSMTYRTLT